MKVYILSGDRSTSGVKTILFYLYMHALALWIKTYRVPGKYNKSARCNERCPRTDPPQGERVVWFHS